MDNNATNTLKAKKGSKYIEHWCHMDYFNNLNFMKLGKYFYFVQVCGFRTTWE